MSAEELREQHITFKKLENTGVRLTVLQIVTICSILWGLYTYAQSRDEKKVLDGSTLNNKIDNVMTYVRNAHAQDSIIHTNQRTLDSILLNAKFSDLKQSISRDVDKKVKNNIPVSRSWYNERRNSPTGPVTLVPVKNQ